MEEQIELTVRDLLEYYQEIGKYNKVSLEWSDDQTPPD
jgi:hypothetical protein